MNVSESDIILKLTNIVDRLLSGKSKFTFEAIGIDDIEDESLKSLAGKIVYMAEQYRDCYGFMMDLSYGRLYTEPPRMNVFANPFMQLHSELRHLTWQIQEIANGDYDQCVSFSGDFSDAINKMINALREKQELTEQLRENENLFRSIFRTSPDGIVLCDMDFCIINASNAAYRMLRITDEVNGRMHFNDLIHSEDKEKFKKILDGLLTNRNNTISSELRVISPNGDCFWSEQNANVLIDSNGNPKGYIIIFRNISERKAAEAQMLQYTDELDEANRTKDKLFSIIAHDLKNAFNPLLGFSALLLQEANSEEMDAEKISYFSKIIQDSASGAFNLLVNLLDWSRLQSNRIVIKPELLNLSNIITENVTMGLTMSKDKNITLEHTMPDDCMLTSDRAMINTILRNLISNAIKYTPQNGRILITLLQMDDMYLVSVQDNGMGITKENLQKLFHTNAIQSTPGTANEKGTGLGLVLCRDFVNKLGGDIWAESVYGHGTTFTFSLQNL